MVFTKAIFDITMIKYPQNFGGFINEACQWHKNLTPFESKLL